MPALWENAPFESVGLTMSVGLSVKLIFHVHSAISGVSHAVRVKSHLRCMAASIGRIGVQAHFAHNEAVARGVAGVVDVG